MAEEAPERSQGGGNVLTRKVGPLPGWGWLALIVGGAIVYLKFIKKPASSSTGSASGTTLPTGSVAYPATAISPSAAGSYGSGGVSGSTPQQLGSILGQLQTLQGKLATQTAKYKALQAQYTAEQKSYATLTTKYGALQSQFATAQKQIGTLQSKQSANTTPNLQIATFSGKEFYVLGGVKPTGTYTGFNVANGAPIYYTWTGNGTPTQGGAPPGKGNVTLYTPTTTPLAYVGNHTKP